MKRRNLYTPSIAALFAVACSSVAAPYGGDDDVAYAGKLWQQMVAANLAGDNAIYSTPYKGAAPHGAYIDTLESLLPMSDYRGRLLIQRNYGGEKLTKAMVANGPENYLETVTVMYQREKGYDREDRDWFWVKYSPAGEVMKDANGRPLAGRVAKGEKEGCIACHKAAPGGDMVFNNDRVWE